MESLIFRAGSGSIPPLTPSLSSPSRIPVVTWPIQGSVAFSGESISARTGFHRRKIHRSYSESDLSRTEVRTLSKQRSRSFTAPRTPEAEREELVDDEWRGFAGEWSVSKEELGCTGGGRMNNNLNSCTGGGGSGDGADIGAYYREMLKLYPTNSLLLTNYARFWHEVERNTEKAEEYYMRAILANPGDGVVLSLYGKLLWETHRDEKRAMSYFNQALQASPQDSMILGSYAHFLWEAEEEEDRDANDGKTEEITSSDELGTVATMVEAF